MKQCLVIMAILIAAGWFLSRRSEQNYQRTLRPLQRPETVESFRRDRGFDSLPERGRSLNRRDSLRPSPRFPRGEYPNKGR